MSEAPSQAAVIPNAAREAGTVDRRDFGEAASPESGRSKMAESERLGYGAAEPCVLMEYPSPQYLLHFAYERLIASLSDVKVWGGMEGWNALEFRNPRTPL